MLADGCSGAAAWSTGMDPAQTSGALHHPHHHRSLLGGARLLQQSAVSADGDSCVTACDRGTARVQHIRWGGPFQEHPQGVEKEGGQVGGHRAKAMCSTVEVSAVLCPFCHFLGDREGWRWSTSLKRSDQPRRKSDSKLGGLAREGGAGCTVPALLGENNEAFIEEGRWRIGRLAGTIWYTECPLASWGHRALGRGMGQFGTLCSPASCGGRELGCGMGQFGSQCVLWPDGGTGKWDLGCGVGQVGTQHVP